MTRETKIGLLVGLAFIIVIGILLSDHFRSTMDPPMASLTDISQTVRKGVTAPGTGNPPIMMVPPSDTPPRQLVPTHDELTPAPRPVVPSARNGSRNDAQPPAGTARDGNVSPNGIPLISGSDTTPENRLANIARQFGESLEHVGPNGTGQVAPSPDANPGAAKEYKAQTGDTVTKMAGRLMGGNTRANRQAIIDANPSLRSDPNHVVVGQTYVIPVFAGSPPTIIGPAVQNPPGNPAGPTNPAPGPRAGESYYTVQPHDSLWKVANDVLHDPNAIEAIKQLNADVLKGKNHDVLTPGMKLRLPN